MSDMNKTMKFLFLNVGIIVVNIVVFGVLHISIGKNTLSTIFGVLVIIASVFAFIGGNISILLQKKKTNLGKDFKDNEMGMDKEYLSSVEETNRKTRVFRKEMNKTTQQLERLNARNNALNAILLQHFKPTEMTYLKFRAVIDSVNSVFRDNVLKILERINMFDENDYISLIYKMKKNPTEAKAQNNIDKMKIYLEHMNYVKTLVEDNEVIIMKMDKLMLELSKLSELNADNIENVSAIQDINELISQTKYYKQ